MDGVSSQSKCSQGMAEMEKRKKRNRVRIELLKSNAAKMTMAYNPMVAVYGEYFSRWASFHRFDPKIKHC